MPYATAVAAPRPALRPAAENAQAVTPSRGPQPPMFGSTIAIIESSLHNAELLAIEEINAKGGVLGKKLQPVEIGRAHV